jgi:hypothetical protein
MKLLTINQLSLSENALKFTYGNFEFQNFPRRTSALRGRNWNWRGGKIGRKKRDGEGRGWGCRGRKGKAKGEGRDGKMKKGRGEKGGGTWKRKLDLRSSRQIDATELDNASSPLTLRPITPLSSVHIASTFTERKVTVLHSC